MCLVGAVIAVVYAFYQMKRETALKTRAEEDEKAARLAILDLARLSLPLQNLPGMDVTRAAYLQRVADYCDQLQVRRAEDPTVLEECAYVYTHLANLYRQLGKTNAAFDYHSRAIAVRERLWKEFTDNEEREAYHLNDLVLSHNDRSILPHPEAGSVPVEVLQRFEALAKARLTEEPRYQFMVAGVYQNAGNRLRQAGALTEALDAYGRTRTLLDELIKGVDSGLIKNGQADNYRDLLGGTLAAMGRTIVLQHEGKKVPDAAGDRRWREEVGEEYFRRAVAEKEKLSPAYKEQPEVQMNVAATYEALAGFYCESPDPEQWSEGRDAHQEAIGTLEGLSKRFPQRVEYKNKLATAMGNLGRACFGKKEFNETRKWMEQAVTARRGVMGAFQGDENMRVQFRKDCLLLAEACCQTGDIEAAIKAFDAFPVALRVNGRHYGFMVNTTITCMGYVKSLGELSIEGKKAQRERYAAKGIELLAEALKRGIIKQEEIFEPDGKAKLFQELGEFEGFQRLRETHPPAKTEEDTVGEQS
jgi:tetratricopeptide (TPR) repeat protein